MSGPGNTQNTISADDAARLAAAKRDVHRLMTQQRLVHGKRIDPEDSNEITLAGIDRIDGFLPSFRSMVKGKLAGTEDADVFETPEMYILPTYEAPETTANLDQNQINSSHGIAIENEGFEPWSKHRGHYADVRRLQTGNPRLNPVIREKVDGLCDYLRDYHKNMADDNEVTMQAYTEMMKGDNPQVKASGIYRYYVMTQREKLLELENKSKLAEELVNYFNGTGPDPSVPLYRSRGAKTTLEQDINTRRAEIQTLFGIDLADPQLQSAMQQPIEPANSDFHIEAIPIVIDKNAFMAKLSGGGMGLTQNEMNFAVATFDNNMSGLLGRHFGGGYTDHRPGTPGYLGKFDSIFINGMPVSDLCAEKTATLKNDTERNNYMKCFVTAQAMGRDKRIEFAIPPNNTPENLRLVSLTTKIQDPPIQEPFWRRALIWLRILDPRQTEQQQYENKMANDPDKAERTQLVGENMEKKEAIKENEKAAQAQQPQADKQNKQESQVRQLISNEDLILLSVNEVQKRNPKTFVPGAAVIKDTIMKKGEVIDARGLYEHGFNQRQMKEREKAIKPEVDARNAKIRAEIKAKKGK